MFSNIPTCMDLSKAIRFLLIGLKDDEPSLALASSAGEQNLGMTESWFYTKYQAQALAYASMDCTSIRYSFSSKDILLLRMGQQRKVWFFYITLLEIGLSLMAFLVCY